MELIRKLPNAHIMIKDLKDGHCIRLTGCVPSQTENLLAYIAKSFEFMVIVAADEQKASEIISNYMSFDKAVCLYPARDPVFFDVDIQGSFLEEQRIKALRRIYDGTRTVIVTTFEAFYEEIVSRDQIAGDIITIKAGDQVDIDELREKLVYIGYSFETQVQGHGEFSVRGSIIDIFPYGSALPYRIDLFGDEAETVKLFDVESQRSVENAGIIEIFPGGDRDKCPDEAERSGRFIDYFNGTDTVFVLSEPSGKIKAELSMNPLSAADLSDVSEISDDVSASDLERLNETLRMLSKKPSLVLSSFGDTPDVIDIFRSYDIRARSIPSYNGRFDDLISDLQRFRKEGYEVLLECASQARKENMIRNLAENGIAIGKVEEDDKNRIKASDIQVEAGAVRSGFEYPDIRFALITEVDIFGARKARRKRKRYSGDPIKEFTDLSVGDYVVHEQHGIGVYEGIERIRTDGVEKDYMKIGYQGSASLYVLATQFDRIQKYSGADGPKPKINKLGGKEWANTKAKTRAAVKDIAEDLVRLYAQRQQKTGFRYSGDSVWQNEFEDSFEYEETDGQLKAIEDVKRDMESPQIMDRLICGDVGFGKTEVAIRAAFKAVQDGKQVAFLTPTTILAKQHFSTVSRRLSRYPVTIRELSRFQSQKEQQKTVKELSEGKADIVVGTHRLLSGDIKFKDLGLLVIDEEQRFGVTHKEKIKQLRKDVDVITLSATPIPRTLHMSLTGIRDMSLLTEPPVDRLPIQTYVMEYSEEAVKEAIMREASRGGQVYYVYNRTNNIDMVAANIQKMLPHLNVSFAHGKMGSRELEQIMFDFIDHRIDILVSTTIIETGLDIPNVNTIIIHDADNFGLSQLYQLRGRVGRSNRTAYAFLMYRKDKLIKEVAEKRLRAIREFSDLGSGIRIAMRDLEIRGAGNVLGAEQSGHMEAVGYELYCKMLNEEVAHLKGEKQEEEFETTIDLDIDGFIPSDYITDEFEKLGIYKRISGINSQEDLNDITDELVDRFGEIPLATENLMNVAFIKAKAHECFVTEAANLKRQDYVRPSDRELLKRERVFKITLLKTAPVDTYKMLDMLKDRKEEISFVPENAPYFLYSPVRKVKGSEEIKKTLCSFFDILRTILL